MVKGLFVFLFLICFVVSLFLFVCLCLFLGVLALAFVSIAERTRGLKIPESWRQMLSVAHIRLALCCLIYMICFPQ